MIIHVSGKFSKILARTRIKLVRENKRTIFMSQEFHRRGAGVPGLLTMFINDPKPLRVG